MKLTTFLLLLTLTAHAQSRYLTSEDFRGRMRGFNASLIESYSVLTGKNLPETKAIGANHARVWVHVQHTSDNRYYFTSPTALKTIDSAVRQAKKIGLYLILTVEFLPKQGADDWWGSSTRKAAIAKFWRDSLAVRYKGEKIIAAYDLMNEPRRNEKLVSGRSKTSTDTEYMTFQSDIINAVRSVDPSHVIAVEVLENQMLARVKPLTQKNLIYSPHGYLPLAITHQGINTTVPKAYPGVNGESYPANYFSNTTYWNDPASFAKRYNAVIWVGEFSCDNWAPKNAYGEWTSTRWIKDAIAYMESLGWSWSYHARREYVGWEADIPSAWYYDPSNGVTFTNGKPSKLPPGSARSSTAPTMTMLTAAFTKNQVIQ